MLPIKHTLLPVFGIASFIIFYFGILHYVTTENYSIDLEDIVIANTQLENTHKMILLDELTSQSVRNFIFTQEDRWLEEYDRNRNALNHVVYESKLNSFSEYSLDISNRQTSANEDLQKIESEIFNHIMQGEYEKAILLMNGKMYEEKKNEFTNTVNEFLEYQKGKVSSIGKIASDRAIHSHNTSVTVLIFAAIVSSAVMIGTFYISRQITKPIEKLETLMTFFSQKGKKPTEISIKTNIKELNELYGHFDEMASTVENTLSLEKKLVEELKETDRQKNEFSSMVSHELKTPLVPIIGYAELLRKPKMGLLNEKQLEGVNAIYDSAKKLQFLIGDILTAQKLDLGKLKFTKTNINIDEFVANQVKIFSPSTKKKQIELINKNTTNTVIISDKDRLGQVFANLISNAIDFVPEETGKIEVGAVDEDNYITFFVKDNGCGIPKGKQENLFKKFYQVDTSVRRDHQGSGLGLSICKGIVEGLGGKIWVKSEVESGTKFYFKIPKTSILVTTEN